MLAVKLRVKKSSIKAGRWVRTLWDDVGAKDGIIIEVREHNALVYEPFNKSANSVEFDQIIAVGNYVKAKDSGL